MIPSSYSILENFEIIQVLFPKLICYEQLYIIVTLSCYEENRNVCL